MTKYLFCGIVFIATISCNTNTDSTVDTIPATEKQLRNAQIKYPDSILLTEKLIQYFRDNSNYSQAIAEADIALKKDSADDRLWDIKGILHFENADTAGAIRAFEKAVEINPLPEYILSLGSLYAQTKNPMALVMADGLLQASKANAQKQAIFIKGLYFSYTGDKVKAIGYFDTCLRLDYRDLFAYREKAICLYDIQKYNDALQVLQQALTIQRTFDEGYYWMGRCYEKLGKKKEAIEHYQAALQIDPAYLEAKDALGKMGISP